MRARKRKRILFIFGTRPEAIKLAPLILQAKKEGSFVPRVCVTGQHREMLDQVLRIFRIRPDYDLGIMKKNQSLFDLTSRGLLAVQKVLTEEAPDMVIVQGDTTSTLVGSLAAFYLQIPVGHVEAGLRSGRKYQPFPEEINRKLASHIAELHFAPTESAGRNLLKEGVPGDKIAVTGNTVVDALRFIKSRIDSGTKRKKFDALFPFMKGSTAVILVTAHRRESFGTGFENICGALREIALNNPGVAVVYPVHLNPNVRDPVNRLLGGVGNVYLIEPQEYEPFVYLMTKAYLVLTDSGGIQEEAPSLGKPVLVMREVTERSEAVEAGVARLIGTGKKAIVEAVEKLLHDKRAYGEMTPVNNPFGDGRSSERIMERLKGHFNERMV